MPKQAHARTIEQREKTDKMKAEGKAHTLTRFCTPFPVGNVYFLSRFRLSFLSDRAAAIVHRTPNELRKNKISFAIKCKNGVSFAEFPYKRESGKKFPPLNKERTKKKHPFKRG